jgi:hypothetical protein
MLRCFSLAMVAQCVIVNTIPQVMNVNDAKIFITIDHGLAQRNVMQMNVLVRCCFISFLLSSADLTALERVR